MQKILTILTSLNTVISIIATILVIGGYIWGDNYIKNYINDNIGTTKEAVLENTKQVKYQNLIIEKRNESLDKIKEYYEVRMSILDEKITKAQSDISRYNSMISGASLEYKDGYKLSAEKSLEYLQLLNDEKKTLMSELSKFIEKNPYTIK